MAASSIFLWQDYLVLFVTLALSAAIGFYYACSGGKQKTTKEYYLADGQMHWFPVAASLMASFISSQTLIGAPSEIYFYGTIFMYQCIGSFLGALIGFIFFLPVFKQLKIISVYEYVELRYSKPMKIIVLILSLINMMLYASLVIYGPALSISVVTGIDIWLAVFSITFIAVLYTLLGGLKAVLWTDALQLCIMIIGIYVVLIYGTMEQGGFANVWEANRLSGRLDFLEPSKMFTLDPRMRHTIWGVLVSTIVAFGTSYGTNQASVQRYLSLPSRRYAIIAYCVTAVGLAMLSLVCSLIGLLIFSYFKNCDPLSSGEITAKDQIYPLYVVRLLGKFPGLSGLILSSVFSGSLSTVSSLLNSAALVILQDFVRPFRPNLTENQATVVSKVLVFVLGAFDIALVLFARFFGAGLMSMGITIAGVFGGPVLALFICGIFLPITNWKGCTIGFLLGSAYGALMGIGGLVNQAYVYQYPVTVSGCNVTNIHEMSNITSPIYDPSTWDPQSHYRSGFNAVFDISYTWVASGAVMVTVITSIIFSIILGKREDPLIDEDLLSPFLTKSCCFLPKSWRARIKYRDEDDNIYSREKIQQKALIGEGDGDLTYKTDNSLDHADTNTTTDHTRL